MACTGRKTGGPRSSSTSPPCPRRPGSEIAWPVLGSPAVWQGGRQCCRRRHRCSRPSRRGCPEGLWCSRRIIGHRWPFPHRRRDAGGAGCWHGTWRRSPGSDDLRDPRDGGRCAVSIVDRRKNRDDRRRGDREPAFVFGRVQHARATHRRAAAPCADPCLHRPACRSELDKSGRPQGSGRTRAW